ncbi:hypothetical protein J6590_025900 [Homalodisca vitripennis]|nr:hypothetical protein J6590_025900 [Homalodisca vitripennis]
MLQELTASLVILDQVFVSQSGHHRYSRPIAHHLDSCSAFSLSSSQQNVVVKVNPCTGEEIDEAVSIAASPVISLRSVRVLQPRLLLSTSERARTCANLEPYLTPTRPEVTPVLSNYSPLGVDVWIV